MTGIKVNRVATIPIAALIVGALISVVMVQGPQAGARNVIDIQPSFGFDLNHPESVFGYAHFVLTGEVTENQGKVDDTTRFTIRPIDEVKGEVPAAITVEQIGFVDGENIYQLKDQPLLRVGETYVLALTAPYDDPNSEVLTILGGPAAAHPIDPNDEMADRGLRTAVENRRWPANLSRQGLGHQAKRGGEWANHHSGYRMANSQAP